MLINFNRFIDIGLKTELGYETVGDEVGALIEFLNETIGKENYTYRFQEIYDGDMIINFVDEDICNIVKFHITLNNSIR